MNLQIRPITDYCYIELAGIESSGRMIRGRFIHKDDSQALSRWRKRFVNTDVFSSICFYSQPNNDSDFICPIYVDIDCSDLSAARESCLILCEMLKVEIGVPQDQIEIHISGYKGFHIVVPCLVFRVFSSPVVLPLYKRMAEKAQESGVKYIDCGVYTKKRIWRLSNSINSKSGLYKIPLFYEELRDLSIESFHKLAQCPRGEDTFVIPHECNNAVKWFQNAISHIEMMPNGRQSTQITKLFKRGWRMPPCVKAIEETTLPDGSRHSIYMHLSRYYAYLNMHPEEIRERILKIDVRNPILDSDSIDRMITWGCSHPGFPGCNNEMLKKFCKKDMCFLTKIRGGK